MFLGVDVWGKEPTMLPALHVAYLPLQICIVPFIPRLSLSMLLPTTSRHHRRHQIIPIPNLGLFLRSAVMWLLVGLGQRVLLVETDLGGAV